MMSPNTVLAASVVAPGSTGERSWNAEFKNGAISVLVVPASGESSSDWIGRSDRGGGAMATGSAGGAGFSARSTEDGPSMLATRVRSGDGVTLTAAARTPARKTL